MGRSDIAARLGRVATAVIALYALLLAAVLAAVLLTFPAAELLSSRVRLGALGAGAGALVVLLLALRARAARRLLMAYLLVLATLFSGAVELYFARDVFTNPRRAIARAAGVPYEAGFPQDIALTRRAYDSQTRISVAPPHFFDRPIHLNGHDIIPIGGAPLRPTVHCNELGATTIYSSDEYGFNNPEGIWRQAPLQVLIIGDSFVEGACVPPEQTMAAKVRESFPRTLSLGRDGSGPLLYLAALREYAPYLQPSTIVWVHTEENDLLNLDVEREISILASYLRPNFRQGLFELQPDLGAIVDRRISDLLDRYAVQRWVPFRATRQMLYNHLRNYAPMTGSKTAKVSGQVNSSADEGSANSAGSETWPFAAVLQTAGEEMRRLQAFPIFVFLPAFGSFSGRSLAADDDRRRVLEAARIAGFHIIEVEAIFKAAMDNPRRFFPFEAFGHYTPEGYALIAQAIVSVVHGRISK